MFSADWQKFIFLEEYMTISKIGAFAIGVGVGVATVAIVKSAGFKKCCAGVVGAGMKLKDEAAAFVETVKEDAEDIVAEAKYNNAQQANS